MPRGFPGGTPSSARQTHPTVTGWWWWWWGWNRTCFLPCIFLSPRSVAFFPASLIVPTTSCILSLPTPLSPCLKFLRVVFPPSFLLRSQLLSVRLSISLFLYSRFLPDRPRLFLVSLLQSRLLSCPFSFPLGLHFLRVVFPPSSFLFSPLLWVGLSLFSIIFSHFLWVGLSPFSFPFSHFLSVGLLPFPLSFLQFLPVFLLPSSLLFSHFLSVGLLLFPHFRPPFSFVLSHFLWVGFLPLPGSFQFSTFRCLLPLSNSFGTRPALDVMGRGLPPLKSIQIHLTVGTGQRSQHHTQVSNTLPRIFLTRHDDDGKNTHASPNTLAIFIDPLDQSATSTQTLSTPYLGGGYPPPPTPSGTPIAPT